METEIKGTIGGECGSRRLEHSQTCQPSRRLDHAHPRSGYACHLGSKSNWRDTHDACSDMRGVETKLLSTLAHQPQRSRVLRSEWTAKIDANTI